MPPVPQRHCGLLDTHDRHEYYAADAVDALGTFEAVFAANPGGGTVYRCTGNPAHYDPNLWPERG